MGEIFSSCNKGGCQLCHDDDIEYEKLINLLSKMHIAGTKDPETLCRGKLYKDFKNESPYFEKIPIMQGELFTLAYNNSLPWAREYYEY